MNFHIPKYVGILHQHMYSEHACIDVLGKIIRFLPILGEMEVRNNRHGKEHYRDCPNFDHIPEVERLSSSPKLQDLNAHTVASEIPEIRITSGALSE